MDILHLLLLICLALCAAGIGYAFALIMQLNRKGGGVPEGSEAERVHHKRLRAPHQHEQWQLQESAKGGMYCAACGEDVPTAEAPLMRRGAQR